jgi:hypothetical protein
MARVMVERAIRPPADGAAAEPEKVFAPLRLIERESVAPPPRASRVGTTKPRPKAGKGKAPP